jgi:hypothetical protein
VVIPKPGSGQREWGFPTVTDRLIQQALLRPYLLGGKAYFMQSQAPAVWRKLDEWMRRRLRAIQLKQWKRGPTIYRELRSLGAGRQVAQKVAGTHAVGGITVVWT